MWSDESDDAEPETLPAVLQRPTIANHIVQERVTVETADHEDHTFCGMMFDVKCIDKLPIEFLEITSVAVRGALGPMTVRTTPLSYKGKFATEESIRHWTLVYEGRHPPSFSQPVPLEFSSPVRLAAGESCGIFVHSEKPGDDAVVYDNFRSHRPRMRDSSSLLSVLPGMAALDCRPFGQTGIWGEGWRSRREFVGRVGMGVCWRLWNPECHHLFPPRFRAVVRCLLLCAGRQGCPLHLLSDSIILYTLNMCRWDWFGDMMQEAADGASPGPRQQLQQTMWMSSDSSGDDWDEHGGYR